MAARENLGLCELNLGPRLSHPCGIILEQSQKFAGDIGGGFADRNDVIEPGKALYPGRSCDQGKSFT